MTKGMGRRDLPQVPPTSRRQDRKAYLLKTNVTPDQAATYEPPVANTFNLASRIQEMVTAQIDAAPFKNVTHVQVYTAQPTASGRGATFTIVMTGPDLNPGNPDTRRIYTVRVTDTPAAR